MDKWGYIFYPRVCVNKLRKEANQENPVCSVMFFLHGCSDKAIDMAKKWEFTKIGSANNLIIVFPQALNCFDFYKMTGEDYLTKDGVQPQFFKGVYEKLLKEQDPNYDYLANNELYNASI